MSSCSWGTTEHTPQKTEVISRVWSELRETHEVALGFKKVDDPWCRETWEMYQHVLSAKRRGISFWKYQICRVLKASCTCPTIPSFSFRKKKTVGVGEGRGDLLSLGSLTSCAGRLQTVLCGHGVDATNGSFLPHAVEKTSCVPLMHKGWWAPGTRCLRCCAIITDNNSGTGFICVWVCCSGTLPA